MLRPATILAGLAMVTLLSACASGGYTRVPRKPGYEGRTNSGVYYHRIENDSRQYVRSLDRYLRLSNRQERNLTGLLADRAYHLLDRTQPSSRDRVYPFPRRDDRRTSGTVERWWDDVDRQIERSLSREQAREYRYLVNQRYGDRYYGSSDRNSRGGTSGRYDSHDNGRHVGWDKQDRDNNGRKYDRRDDDRDDD